MFDYYNYYCSWCNYHYAGLYRQENERCLNNKDNAFYCSLENTALRPPYMILPFHQSWPSQPLMMFDPMMYHILGTCTTDPVPMIPPYSMPTALESKENTKGLEPNELQPNELQPNEQQNNKQKAPTQWIKRRHSLIENVLDSFSLLNSQPLLLASGLDTSSSVSDGVKSLDQPSQRLPKRLSRKASVLRNRQYIWCYRPQTKEENISWTAFDIKNQLRLDKQYALLVSKAQQNEQAIDPGIILNKQSPLAGQVMVSLSTGKAYCMNDTSILYDVAYLPSQSNALVVSTQTSHWLNSLWKR